MIGKGMGLKGLAALAAGTLALLSAGVFISHQCHQESVAIHGSVEHHESSAGVSSAPHSADLVGEVCIGVSLLLLLAIGRRAFLISSRKNKYRSAGARMYLSSTIFRRWDMHLPALTLAAPLRI